ncbi:MAG: DUF1638 domain-containing protein [Flavobacteriaceae bacterium]
MTPYAEKILVIACGMLAREIQAVCEQAGLAHVDLTCLPAMFHHRPERIAPAVEEAIGRARSEGYDRIFIGYGDCGTGGALDKVCERLGVQRIEGPHCFAFYQGNAAFQALGDGDMRAFYMTDFLARQVDAFLIEPLGLDRHPELLETYFGNYEKLVFLAQTDDPALTRVAEATARRLGLAFERRNTGYGDLASSLKALV